MKTPIVLVAFNRPGLTAKVFESIQQVKPSTLFLIADGPRPECKGEIEKCASVRAVLEQIDWDCTVFKNYSEVNLGCAKRVSSGLDWVFEMVEEAIILEDDCLPHPSFFPFCEELLEKYRSDQRILTISGDNSQLGRRRNEYSYYFSRYFYCWGWATWRRSWKHYDHQMKFWPEICEGNWLQDILQDPIAVEYWTHIFQSVALGQIDSWACRFTLSCWIQSGLNILSSTNLVSNIGFGSDATHTHQPSKFSNQPVEPMNFPLKHPPFIICDSKADKFSQENRFFHPTILFRLKRAIKRNLLHSF